MKKAIVCFVLLFVILVLVNSSLAGKNKRKNKRKKSSSSSEISTTLSSSAKKTSGKKEANNGDARSSSTGKKSSDNGGRGSRRKGGRRGRRRKKLPVLKTSMRAKKITERKYLKKDWCKSQPVRQHLRTKSNCHGVVINQFCYGQCNSFYIPKDIEIDSDHDIVPDYFKSCSFCKPKTLEWVSVRLRCKNIDATRMPRFITKRIRRVKGCTCIAVPDLEESSENEPEVINPESPTSNTLVLATIESES